MNDQVRKRIDEHLDAIDRILTDSGMTRSERRNITDDVESQILDMLGARSGDDPTLAELEAILAELDPPEAYAQNAPGAPLASTSGIQAIATSNAAPTTRRGLGITSLVLALLGTLIIVPVVLFISLTAIDVHTSAGVSEGPDMETPVVVPADPGEPRMGASVAPFVCLAIPFISLEIAAFICGVIAWRHPCGKAGAILSGIVLLGPVVLLTSATR